MAIFPFLNKKKPVLFRCTQCYYEFELPQKQVHQLENQNHDDPICPLKEICHMCHSGFMIPVKYTNKNGKIYLFHEIKPKIKKLDPDTVFKSIFEHPDNEIIMFFPLYE